MPPYGGEKTREQVEKIERCVKKVMSSGKEKGSAIAICKKTILGEGRDLRIVRLKDDKMKSKKVILHEKDGTKKVIMVEGDTIETEPAGECQDKVLEVLRKKYPDLPDEQIQAIARSYMEEGLAPEEQTFDDEEAPGWMTECMAKMEGNVDNPAAVCQWVRYYQTKDPEKQAKQWAPYSKAKLPV